MAFGLTLANMIKLLKTSNLFIDIRSSAVYFAQEE
jgi:hypothetical protein